MKMETARELLQVPKKNTMRFSQHITQFNSIIYESYALRGIRIDRVEPGFVSSSFKVPARLIDRNGNMASAAVANLVDVIGGASIYVEGLPVTVSVDISISYFSTAKLNDELEISSKLLGRMGGYSGTVFNVKNKLTRELIAQGRHSLYGRHASKL